MFSILANNKFTNRGIMLRIFMQLAMEKFKLKKKLMIKKENFKIVLKLFHLLQKEEFLVIMIYLVKKDKKMLNRKTYF